MRSSKNVDINRPFYLTVNREELFKKDIWHVNDLGIQPYPARSGYRFNFSKIYPLWLHYTLKKFVYYQSATKTYNTCRCYITALRQFSQFIIENRPELNPADLDRSCILDYLSFLQTQSLTASSKISALIHLRKFIEIATQEEWLPFPKNQLIYPHDIPRRDNPMPRFIPESVMTQLRQHMHQLPGHIRRFIFILQETGRRIGELCTMTFDCLNKDDQGDYFLKVDDKKLKKSYLIPITHECEQTIREQQNHVRSLNKESLGYLFMGSHTGSAPHPTSLHIRDHLSKLVLKNKIVDEHGNLWHFQAHQFRHTVGTRMINAGVSQPIVQRYLGHESPEMTSRYAYIHDQTLKEAFAKFQGKLINIHGKIVPETGVNTTEEQWFKRNILTQALPNGYCGLPLAQQRCPHANACLTCANFKTNGSFLPQHTKQLEETNLILDVATKNGWQRQAEMNREVKINLETIIATLREKKNEPA